METFCWTKQTYLVEQAKTQSNTSAISSACKKSIASWLCFSLMMLGIPLSRASMASCTRRIFSLLRTTRDARRIFDCFFGGLIDSEDQHPCLVSDDTNMGLLQVFSRSLTYPNDLHFCKHTPKNPLKAITKEPSPRDCPTPSAIDKRNFHPRRQK